MKFNKIVILEKTGIEEFAMEQLQAMTTELVIYSDSPKSNEEILERSKGADCILISWTSSIDESVLSDLPELKYIGMCCSLYNDESANVDLAAAKGNSVTVTGVRDYGDQGVVQYLFSELIQLLLGTHSKPIFDEPIELESLKLGIIGLGSVGKKVAQVASFFNMDVYYYGRRIQDDVPYTYLPLETLLQECDIISLHLPKNTIVLNQNEFDIMRGKKILINTGLGFSFNREAFEHWIQNNEHYAILDTDSIDNEFRENHLLDENIIMNNIVSGFTKNARRRLSEKVIHNLKEYLQGESSDVRSKE